MASHSNTPVRRSKRKSVHCHRISPQAKHSNRLQGSQVGVCRTLVSDSQISPHALGNVPAATLSIFQHLVKSAVADALKEEREHLADEIYAKIRNEFGITVRSLISEWIASPQGKGALRDLTESLNKAYAHRKIPRRVLQRDVLKEIKHFIKTDDLQSKELLKLVEGVIADTFTLPGDELVGLLKSFLQTNVSVHVQWTQAELQRVINEAKERRLQAGGETRTSWVMKMALDIASGRGWHVKLD